MRKSQMRISFLGFRYSRLGDIAKAMLFGFNIYARVGDKRKFMFSKVK